MDSTPYTIARVHPSVGRYLKRQERRVQDEFWTAIEKLRTGPLPLHDPTRITHLKGPYHCSYRYVLKRGKHGRRIKYDVDTETRQIYVYDFGPRGEVY